MQLNKLTTFDKIKKNSKTTFKTLINNCKHFNFKLLLGLLLFFHEV